MGLFIVTMIRLLRGYVTFYAWGNSVERLMNLAAQNRLTLWDFKKQNGVFTGKILVSDYKALARLAKKIKVRTCAKKRKGLPFLIHRYRKRLGLLLGLLFVLAFLLTMQNFIWVIEVTGNQEIPSQQILDQMKDLGLKRGTFIPSIDFQQMELKARSHLDGVSWVAVNHSGSRVWIEVQESVKAPEMLPGDHPSNIIADKAGQIVKMEVYSGQAMVQTGDTVDAGDLIISGAIEDTAGNTIFRRSSAKVIAITQFEKVIRVPLRSQVKHYTGEVKKRYLLDLFGLKLPLFLAKKQEGQYDLTSSYQGASLWGMNFPFGLYTNEYKMYEMQTLELTDVEASEKAEQLMEEYEKKELKDVKILKKKTDKSLKNGEFFLKIQYTCEEQIGKSQEIYLDNGKNQKS